MDKNVEYLHNGILLSSWKNEIRKILRKWKEQEENSSWGSPDPERQICYWLTYNWILAMKSMMTTRAWEPEVYWGAQDLGTEKSCQERETDSYGMMGWLNLEDLVGSRNVFLVFSLWFALWFIGFVLFQFVSFLFILLLLKCLFSSMGQKGVVWMGGKVRRTGRSRRRTTVIRIYERSTELTSSHL